MRKIVRSYAKINLGLHVVKKTKKNYHKLKMIMTEIELCDEIIFEQNDEVIVAMDNDICAMENNLCYKVACYLKRKYNIDKGIKITIIKKIPDGGGLGGGSSNAAAVLKYLNKAWDINLNTRQLIKIGYMFGCDIPFFIKGDISLVGGYGEKIKPLKVAPSNDDILLIVPNFKNSTREVFEQFASFQKNRIKKLLTGLKQGGYKGYIFNDLEEAANVVSDNGIFEIKEIIKREGVDHIVMSGSGSTIVCFFESGVDIDYFKKRLKFKLENCRVIKSKLKMYSS